MKQYIKRYIKWVTEKKEPEEVVGYIMGGTLGIVLGVIFFIWIDKVPATPYDFYQLERRANYIQYNPELLLYTECNIDIEDEIITITYENDECFLYVKYNKDFEILKISKHDKYVFWLGALALAVFIGGLVTEVGSFVIILIIILIETFIRLIYKISRKIKARIKR